MGEMFALDRSGHQSVIKWGRTEREIEAARNIFQTYKERGFTMFRMTEDDSRGGRLDEFDPEAHGIIAVPRMQGGSRPQAVGPLSGAPS